jgi:hypothetical protein
MAENLSDIRDRDFADNWLAWTALRHFLPARSVRELASAILQHISAGELSLGELFDEELTGGPAWIESWLLVPRALPAPVNPLADYLQRRIRTMAWDIDVRYGVPPELSASTRSLGPAALEAAFTLGTVDFEWPEKQLDDLRIEGQSGAAALHQAIRTGKNLLRSAGIGEFRRAIVATLAAVGGPLRIIIAKHLGDLCADADEWEKAAALYEEAQVSIGADRNYGWHEFERCMQAIITQSRASAIRTVKGAGAAADFWKQLSAARIANEPLLLANASNDALEAAHADRKRPPADRRATLLMSPLVARVHNAEAALHGWLMGEYGNIPREFWAVLRRQIALGCAVDIRSTKSLYARSILDSLNVRISSLRHYVFFQMAIRLLVESEDTATAERVAWSEQLVEAYVNTDVVRSAIEHAEVYEGSRSARTGVVLELFLQWVQGISAALGDVAATMLKYVAATAGGLSTSVFTSENLGGRSFEVLHQLAQKRPEFREQVAEDVAAAIISKLTLQTFWTAALETASDYGDVFPRPQLEAILDAALRLLAEIRPAAETWPVVRPTLTFLGSRAVKHLSGSEPELGHRIVETYLRFGIGQETQQAQVLFYLHDFDSNLLRDPAIAERLRDTVAYVRRQAQQINSSNAVENIVALLTAPVISSREGVESALLALSRILETAGELYNNMSLPYAYEPLLLLAQQKDQIAKDIFVTDHEFELLILPILDLVREVWRKATEQPLLLASFSLPLPTIPNATIVHNWAYASIVFAEALGETDSIAVVLDVAGARPELADAIALARATRSVARADIEINPLDIRSESRDTFYSVLGRHLAILQTIREERARKICMALVDQCFRQGPRALDVGVFLSAWRLGLRDYVSSADYGDYMNRLSGSQDQRLALNPILEMLGVPST